MKLPDQMIGLAEDIIDRMSGKFEPEKFEDRYENALKDLIKAKKAGKEPPAAPTPKPSNVINLMDALRRSAQGQTGNEKKTGTKSSGRRSGAKRSSHKKKATKHKKLKQAS